MPPLRTFTPIKAIKTERTHEENQERAYIAASRRSDRSLEARVESARRASEIHKRRTGRSLRVTEQDVINEEMYEEEDDDLPSQYRRLTAHLQTGSADFNRRLAAYLTNNVAMRSAFDQAITSSYAQQFPNAPRFAHNNPSLFPSPLMTHGTMNPAQAMPQHESPSSPHSYRSSPYPMPGMSGYRQQMANNRAGSMNFGDQKPAMSPTMSIADRRMSASTPKPTTTNGETSSKSPEITKESLKSPKDDRKRSHDAAFEQFQQSIGPLTTTLPGDSQQLLGFALDMSDPFNSMLMGNMGGQQNFMDNSFYGYPGKESNFYPNLDGMNSTLAPKATLSAQQSFDGTPAHAHGSFNLDFSNLKGVDFNASDSGSGKGSAHPTPGIDGGWDAFINDNSWAENAT